MDHTVVLHKTGAAMLPVISTFILSVCSSLYRPAGVCWHRKSALCISHDAGGRFLHGPHQQQYWWQSGGPQTRYHFIQKPKIKDNIIHCSRVKWPTCVLPRHFVREQHKVSSAESSSPLRPGVEGVQSCHHCWRNYAACELLQRGKRKKKKKKSRVCCLSHWNVFYVGFRLQTRVAVFRWSERGAHRWVFLWWVSHFFFNLTVVCGALLFNALWICHVFIYISECGRYK